MSRGFVYIVTNNNNTVLYTGVTSNLYGRCVKHKTNYYPTSFTSRYNLHKLVYYEAYPSMALAIAREKQIKAGSRKRKEALINKMNPEWKDLFDTLS